VKTKPSLAEDAILDSVRFECIAQPKIDGVRAMNLDGTLTGRSLDPFEGFGITEYFSRKQFLGFDGEMTLGAKPNCTERLCSLTTGAMGRFKGVDEMADLHWWVFDYITPETVAAPYHARYAILAERVRKLGHPRIHLIPSNVVVNRLMLDSCIGAFAADGYEGTIIRNPLAIYKEGRASKKNQELWRVKPWSDFEILVTKVVEADANTNAKKTNTLGRSERSSAKAGKVPKGMLGSIEGIVLADFHDPLTKKLLFKKGLQVTAGRGEMTADEAADYYTNPHKIVGHIAKIKTMTHGVKDLPRFPTYKSHRLSQDMS